MRDVICDVINYCSLFEAAIGVREVYKIIS